MTEIRVTKNQFKLLLRGAEYFEYLCDAEDKKELKKAFDQFYELYAEIYGNQASSTLTAELDSVVIRTEFRRES